jgi:hypothetical protein
MNDSVLIDYILHVFCMQECILYIYILCVNCTSYNYIIIQLTFEQRQNASHILHIHNSRTFDSRTMTLQSIYIPYLGAHSMHASNLPVFLTPAALPLTQTPSY